MTDLFKSAAEAGAEVRRLGHLNPNDQRDPALTQLGEMAAGGMQAVRDMAPAEPRRGIEKPVVKTPQNVLDQYMSGGPSVNDKAQAILSEYMGSTRVETAPQVPETQGSLMGDVGRSVARGGIALGGGFYELLNLATRGELDTVTKKAFGTSGTEALSSARNSLNQADSAELQRQRKQLEEADGFWDSVGTVLTNPRLAGSMAVEMVPQMSSVLGAAKVAATKVLASQLAKGATREVAETAAQRAATMTVMGVNPALESGMAASDTRSAILQMSEADLQNSPQYQALLTQGYNPTDARARLANDAATFAAAVTAPISLVSNSLTASFEAKLVTPGVAKQFGLKALGKEVGTGLIKEVPGEALEEGGSQFGQNVGTKLSGAKPDQDLWQGVPQAAGAGAALGGIAGAGFGAANARFGLKPASGSAGNTDGTPSFDSLSTAQMNALEDEIYQHYVGTWDKYSQKEKNELMRLYYENEPLARMRMTDVGRSQSEGAATRRFDGILDDDTFTRTLESRNIVPAMTAMWASSDPQTQSQIEELARRNNMFVNFSELAADGRTLDRGVELLNQAGGAFVQSFLNRTAVEVSNPLKDQPLPPKTPEETPEDLQRRSFEADAVDSGEAAIASAEDAGIQPRLTEEVKARYMQGYQRRAQNIEASERPAERVLMATFAIQDMIRQGFTADEANAMFGQYINPSMLNTGTIVPNMGTNVPNEGTSFEQTKQSLIQNYQDKYGIDVKPEEIIEVPVDKGIAQIAQQFGVPVYAYRYTGGQRKIQLIKGSRAGSGIVLNANAPDAHMNVFGHEVYHELAKRDPAAAAQLNGLIQQYLSEEGKQKYAAWLKETSYDPAKFDEEMAADVLGVLFTDSEFWSMVNAQNQTLVEKILSVISDLISKLKANVNRQEMYTKRGRAMQSFITDYDAIRKMLAQFVADAAKKPKAVGSNIQSNSMTDEAETVTYQEAPKEEGVLYTPEVVVENKNYVASVTGSEQIIDFKQSSVSGQFTIKGMRITQDGTFFNGETQKSKNVRLSVDDNYLELQSADGGFARMSRTELKQEQLFRRVIGNAAVDAFLNSASDKTQNSFSEILLGKDYMPVFDRLRKLFNDKYSAVDSMTDISGSEPVEQDSEFESAPFTYARFSKNGYEVSTKGDKRFSAFNARLIDGRTIEEAYQLDIKGYRQQGGTSWRDGKGKPAVNGKNNDQLYADYLALWQQWAKENPQLIEELRQAASGKTLTDMFASGPVNQARALSDILNGNTAAKKPAEAAPVQEMADVDPAEEVKRLAREGKKADAARAFRDADLYKQTGIPFERFYAEATKPVTNVTENVTEKTPVRWAENEPMRNLNPKVGTVGTYNNEKPKVTPPEVIAVEKAQERSDLKDVLLRTLARKGQVGYFIYQAQKKFGVRKFTVGDLKKMYADEVARRAKVAENPPVKAEKTPEPKQIELGSDVVDQGTMARFARRLDQITGELFAPSKFRNQIDALDRQLEAMSETNRKKAEDGEKPRSDVEYIFENLAREGAFGADEIAALQAREKELSTLNKDETGAFKSEGVAANNLGAALREKIIALQKMEIKQRAKALRDNIDKVDDALTELRSEMEGAGIPQNLIDDMLLEKERGVNALIENKDNVKDESLPQMVENELDVNMEDTTTDMFGDKSIAAAQIVDAMLAKGEITDVRALHRIFDEFDAAGLGNLDIYNEMRLRGMEIPVRQYNWASRPGYQYSLDYWLKKNKDRDSYRVREEWFASLDKTLREMNSDADRNEVMNGLTAEEKKLLADWRQQRTDLSKRLTQKAENIEGEVYLFDSVNDAYPHTLFNKYPLSSMFDIEKIPEADRPALLSLVDGKADMLPSLWYQDLNTVLSERPDLEGEVFDIISEDERAKYEEWRTRATREYLRNAQALANSPAFSQLFQLQSYLTTEQYDQYRNQIALATQNQHAAILQAAWELAEAQRLAQEKKSNVDTATDAVLQQVYNQDETSTDVTDTPAFSLDEEGDTTGDTFETEQAAIESEPSELLDRVRLKTGRYSGVTVAADIFAHINQIVSKWANAPRFVVLNNHMQLPEEMRDYVTSRLGSNLTAKGMLGPDGTVYLFSDFLESMDDAEFVFFHEVEGHYGLRAFLGDKLDGFLDAQYRANKRVREAADAIIAEAQESGVGVSRLEATEEAIADLAASGKDQSLFATIVSALIKFLRQIRMDGVADWIQTQSLSNLGFVLSQARKAARNGTISPLAGAPSDIRLATEKKPVEIFGVRKGQTTAYAMYNPLTANWTVFYNPNGLGATTFGIQTFDNYADALALVREHGKAISAKDHPKRKTYGPGSFNQVKITDVANVGKWTSIARQAYMKTVNKLLPIIEVVKQIEAQGGKTNLLQAITLYRGRIKPYWDQFRRDILRPISKHIKAVEESGDTYKFDGVEYKGQDLIDLYLLALHAEERNKVIQNLDPEKKDGAGISTKEAKKIIEDLQGMKSYDDMVQVSILTQTLSQMKVNYMLQTDLINAAQSRGLNAYNYYVNLSGNRSDVDEAVNREMLGGRALNMRGNDARRALGRESIPVNILENTLNNYLATIVRGQKNIVAQSVYDMVINNPDPDFAVVNPFVMVKALDIDKLVADKVLLSMLGDEPTVASGQLFVNQLKSAVKADPSKAAWAAGEMYNRLYVAYQQGRVSANQFVAMTQKIENADMSQRNVFSPDGYIKEEVDNDRMKRDDVMVVKIQGKPVLMEFRHGTDQEGKVGTFISAIHGRTEPSEGFSEFMGAISREIGQMITSRNLAWVPVNWMRDIGTAFFNAAVDPKVGMELARKMMARAPQSYGVAYKNLIKEEYADKNSPVYKLLKKFGNKPVDPQAQEMWDEFVQSGAQVFFIDRKDIQDQIKDMKEELNPSGGLKGTWNAYGKFTDLLGMPAEASARFAAYRTLREAGWSIQDAAVYAKNITVNFEQSGSLRAMRNFFMFANPSIQGSARLLQGMTIRTPDGKIRPNSKFLAMAGALAGFGLVLGFIARAFGDNGEDEVNDLDKIPRYKRATSVVIAPGVPLGSPLPMPYGWNVFYALGNFAADSMFGKTPVSQTASRVMASAVDSFWPLGQSDSGTALGAVVKSVTPTVVSPFYEYLMNESRFGGPIYKGDNPFVRAEEASSFRNFESASPISVFMMRGLNSLTGGNQYKPGMIDINPAFVDYIAQAFLPGPATDVGRALNLGIRAAQGRDIKNVPLPLVDRFGSKVSEGWDAGAFRRAVTFVDTKYAEAKNATRDERDVLLKEHPNLGNAKGALSNIDQTIRDMRTTLRGIESNPNIPFPQKVEARNRIEALEKMYHQKGVQIAIKAGFRQPLLADQ